AFVDEVHYLFTNGGAASGRRWFASLLGGWPAENLACQALRPVAHAHHRCASQLDGLRVGGFEEKRCRGCSRAESLFSHAAQEVAHCHRDITEVDVDWAGLLATMADCAVVRYVAEFIPMFDGDAAAGLFLVQERFYEE